MVVLIVGDEIKGGGNEPDIYTLRAFNLEWDRFGWFIREIGPPTHFLSR